MLARLAEESRHRPAETDEEDFSVQIQPERRKGVQEAWAY